jgi:prophage DNA circulation protein
MAEAKKLSLDLRSASFRGVPFEVDASDLGAGRRTQLHEYPQRDKPYVEDLGRATRELSFDAFVVGADYVAQATKLLAALETAGPGTLVHPWLGTLTVSLKDSAKVSFSAALGQARFSLSFIEAGELTFPSAATATQAQSRIAAGKLETAAGDSFASKFSIKGVQDFVAAAASGNLGSMLGIVSAGRLGAMLGYANSLAATVTTAIALISNPATLGWKLLGALGLSGLATTVAAWSSVVRSLARLVGGSDLAAPAAPAVYTPSRQQAWVNASAVNAIARQALIAQAVGASSLVGTGADTTPPLSHADMMAVRNELIAAIDAEALQADDGVYDALMAARAAVWADLTTRARDSARLTTLTPAETTPALVLAYDAYQDATRDAELVARNAVRHPGFVPARPLKLLTR